MEITRRRFVQGLAAGGTLLSIPPGLRAALRGSIPDETRIGTPVELRGTEFDLTIAETPVNFTGRQRLATTINGSIPGPVLRWREGDVVTIRVTNRLPVSTSIHWHGIILPFEMDGVPGVSFPGIAPGETFVYRFRVRQAGTYWYHSHTAFQEQTGMYGAIIVDPADGRDRWGADRDHVIQLSDWTDEDPFVVMAKLKKMSDYYNFNQPTFPGFLREAVEKGLEEAWARRAMWYRMRMNPTDLSDVSGYTYTYLMNGTPPAGNWTALFRPGERVRLRFISSGTQSFFDVRIPGLKMTVVHVDGQDIHPVTVDEFRCGPGETYDVIVEPEDRPYTIYAQSMDRSGYARGTLSPRPGLEADVPEPDPVQWLEMRDMMGAMAMGAMGGGNHRHAMHAGMHGKNMSVRARHASTEYGPSVDMRVDQPRTNLDDPGVGLRNNGRHVLTYADIRTLGGPIDTRDAEREIELHLTGNMERYTWSLDGLEFGKSSPVHFRYGERLRIVLVNDTMMTHPMHLHGMWSELESPEGEFLARRHTISVQPAQRVSFLVTADAPGRWAWHCHLLYHMDAGMFRVVVVD